MSDVSEWTAMDEGWCLFQCLNQIWQDRLSKEQGHGTGSTYVLSSNGSALKIFSDNDASDPLSQISWAAGK